MKVIGSSTSPFARKVRVALLETGLAHSFQPDSSWSTTDTVSQLNPLGKLPVLVCDDGAVLIDSPLILEYLDTVAGPGSLLSIEWQPRLRAKQLEALADGVCEAVTLCVQETWRPEGARSQVWLQRQGLKIDRGIEALDRELGEQDWLAGNCLTVADIAAGCALGLTLFWFPQKRWLEDFPRLAAYWRRLDARPSFTLTTPVLAAGASFPQL